MGTQRDVGRQAVPVADWARWSATARGRVSRAWADELKRDPLLRKAQVVVDVVIGQRRIRASTRPLRSTSLDGSLNFYHQDLIDEPEMVGAVELRVSEPQSRSVSLTVCGELAQIAEVMASGWPLAGVGEVALLMEGMRWEDRIVYVRGPISGSISFGTVGENVTLTISDPQVASVEIPPWTVSRQRWPTAPDSGIGEAVPVVLTTMPKAPCVHVARVTGGSGYDRFLVGQGVLTVDEVYVDGVVSGAATPVVMQDQLGLKCTVVEFAEGVVEETSSVHVTATPPGLSRRTLVESIRRVLVDLGQVALERISERLFSEASIRLADVGATPSGRTSPLIVLNESVRIIDYLSDLLSDWPMVSMVWDGAGIGPVVMDHRAPPVAKLQRNVYPMLDRPEGAQYETTPTTELRTSFRVRYSYNMIQDIWAGMVQRHPENSDLCRMALQITEVEQQEGKMEALSIGDAATANQTVDWLVEHLARPSVAATVAAYPEAWLMLREGDTIWWTDESANFIDTPGIILSRRYGPPNGGTRVEIGMLLFPGLPGKLSGQSRS